MGIEVGGGKKKRGSTSMLVKYIGQKGERNKLDHQFSMNKDGVHHSVTVHFEWDSQEDQLKINYFIFRFFLGTNLPISYRQFRSAIVVRMEEDSDVFQSLVMVSFNASNRCITTACELGGNFSMPKCSRASAVLGVVGQVKLHRSEKTLVSRRSLEICRTIGYTHLCQYFCRTSNMQQGVLGKFSKGGKCQISSMQGSEWLEQQEVEWVILRARFHMSRVVVRFSSSTHFERVMIWEQG